MRVAVILTLAVAAAATQPMDRRGALRRDAVIRRAIMRRELALRGEPVRRELALRGEPVRRELALRQLPGDSVNGPTAISNPNVNNGAQKEGSLEDSTSFDGAAIINPVGNDLTDVNNNLNLHDNVFQNPNFNVASNTEGPAVVGNDNQVFPGLGAHAGLVFKRQSAVNAPAAINNPNVNTGSEVEGSLEGELSFDGANVVNPVGNDLTQLNSNEEVSGNNFENPNWNAIDNNNGPAMAGNNNIFVPVTNEQGAIQFDNGDLMDAAMLAAVQGPAF